MGHNGAQWGGIWYKCSSYQTLVPNHPNQVTVTFAEFTIIQLSHIYRVSNYVCMRDKHEPMTQKRSNTRALGTIYTGIRTLAIHTEKTGIDALNRP